MEESKQAPFKVSRFSIFEPENRDGIMRNCHVLLDGERVTDVQVADAFRGTVKQLVRNADGGVMVKRFLTDAEARTCDLKGSVEIIVLDVRLYLEEQRARLDEIEAQFAPPVASETVPAT